VTVAHTKSRPIVVIGASAGGIPVLRELFSNLAPGNAASYFVVLHRAPSAASNLVAVLGRRSTIEVKEPIDGDRFKRNVAYLAPADRHMRLDHRTIRIDRGPKEHHTRPAIDPLFVSAAQAHGDRAVGVLLSGNLSDGVAGLIEIKAAGGLSLAQDPREAEWPSMPHNALLYDHVDVVFESAFLPEILRRLVRGQALTSSSRASRDPRATRSAQDRRARGFTSRAR
jgi:two-component system, chemotaxis family, protein-glutamate methylesterase/glutaminase